MSFPVKICKTEFAIMYVTGEHTGTINNNNWIVISEVLFTAYLFVCCDP